MGTPRKGQGWVSVAWCCIRGDDGGVSFREHAASCPDGQPPDGSRRLDLCPDFNTFPVWVGNGTRDAEPLNLSTELTACLNAWAQEWEEKISAAHSLDKPTMDRWLSQYDDLAESLHNETGAIVVGHGLIDLRSEDCPHCGTTALVNRALAKRPGRRVRRDSSIGPHGTWHPYS